MKNLSQHLKNRTARVERFLQKYASQLETNFNWRLGLSIVFSVGMIGAAAFPQMNIGLPLFLAFIIPFLWLLRKTNRIKALIRELKELKAFYERQCRNTKGAPSRKEFSLGEENTLAHDLDLMGPRSLLALIDETITVDGHAHLTRELNPPNRSREELISRQNLVRLLSKSIAPLRKWIVSSVSKIDEDAENNSFSKLLSGSHGVDVPKAFLLALYLSFFSFLGALLLTGLDLMGTDVLSYVWFAFFLLSMVSLKYSGPAFSFAQTLESQIPFQLKYVGKAQSLAESDALGHLGLNLIKHNPIKKFNRIKRYSSLLSVQSHPLLLILVNGLLPWNLFFAIRFDKLLDNLSEGYKDIERDLVLLESFTCLSLLYHYQSDTFPEFSDEIELSAKNIYHPLLDRETAIKNSVKIESQQRMNLITGSNMSGKSTFLRTLGINQVLAMMGAPVFAEKFLTFPGQVESCVRVSDSVEYGYSYFYSEVRRVKSIIDSASGEAPILYLIDEIFKGTNNYERLEGSKGVLKALSSSKSLGFVSTHDLELTKMEGDAGKVSNWHFREDVENGVMVFDYTLRSGPSPSTNALKIMADAGLPVKI